MKNVARLLLSLALLGGVLSFTASTLAQGAGAKRAIEQLERCSAQERNSGCVRILKKKPVDDQRLRVKAQVRGKRIIWYEYNKKSGAVKRAN